MARTGERISWPLLSRKKNGYVSQAGTLSGIGGLPTPRRIELSPYVVVKNGTRDYGAPREGGLSRYEHPSQATVGADLKVGLSSNLTLDATINPDFGQVEADPAVVNLSTQETFYPDKRPFFSEGSDAFKFKQLRRHRQRLHGPSLRRIGRSPQPPRLRDATAPRRRRSLRPPS